MRPSKRFTRPADTPDAATTAPRRVFRKGRYSNAPPLVVDLNAEHQIDAEGQQHVIEHGTPAASYGAGFSKYDGRSLGGHAVVPGQHVDGSDAIEPDEGDVKLDAQPMPVEAPAPEALLVDLTARLGTWGSERRYESDRYWRKDSRRL